MERNRAVTVRMSDPERSLLFDLAESFGMSISDVVRQLIRREHETRARAPRPRKNAAAECAGRSR